MIGRISERRIFQRLGREGRRAGTEHLWCRYLPDQGLDRPHVSFAIGRAVGGAVVRNRLRRRLRALGSTLPPGWWMIGARPTVGELTFEMMAAELRSLAETASRP